MKRAIRFTDEHGFQITVSTEEGELSYEELFAKLPEDIKAYLSKNTYKEGALDKRGYFHTYKHIRSRNA